MTVLSNLRDRDCGTEWTLTLEMPQTTQYLKANLKPFYSESAMLTYCMMFSQFLTVNSLSYVLKSNLLSILGLMVVSFIECYINKLLLLLLLLLFKKLKSANLSMKKSKCSFFLK